MGSFDLYRNDVKVGDYAVGQDAIDNAIAGDEIRVLNGTHYQRLVFDGRSDLTLKPQVFGARPIITGADQTLATSPSGLWESLGDGKYRADLAAHAFRTFVRDAGHTRLMSWETQGEFDAATIPSAYIDGDADKVYVDLGGADPNSTALWIASRLGTNDSVLKIFNGSSNVLVESMELRDGGLTALEINGTSNVTVTGCRIRGGVNGVIADGSNTNLRLELLEPLGYLDPDWLWLTLKGNVHMEGAAILVLTDGGSIVDGISLSGWFNGISTTSTASVDNNRGLIIRNCLLADIMDDAFEFEGYYAAGRVYNNLVRNAYRCIGMAARFCQTEADRLHIYRNTFVADRTVRRDVSDYDPPLVLKTGASNDPLRGGASFGSSHATFHSNLMFSTHDVLRGTFGPGPEAPTNCHHFNNRVISANGSLVRFMGTFANGNRFEGQTYELLNRVGTKFVDTDSSPSHDYNRRPNNPDVALPPGTPDTLPKVSLNSIAPPTGPTAGGNMVVIEGQGFDDSSVATIDGNPLTDVVIMSTSISGKAPAGTAGAKDVEVNTGGQIGTLVDGYTYA